MAASFVLLQTLLFRTSSSSLIFKPLSRTSVHLQKPFDSIFNAPSSCNPPYRPRFFCNSSSSSSSSLESTQNASLPVLLREESNEDVITEGEEIEASARVSSGSSNSTVKLPSLSVKEKKELSAYAHSLGKKLKCQQVGKSGVTSSVAASFVENLEANELLKLKVHNNCPGEFADVVKQLEEATGSVAVGQIGRSVILYRPSLTKLKAEEKRGQTRRITGKGFRVKTAELMQKNEQTPRLSGRGRRGRSRFAAPVTDSNSPSQKP